MQHMLGPRFLGPCSLGPRFLGPDFITSVSGLVSEIWYRIPFDQSALTISKFPPTDSPTARPGRNPYVDPRLEAEQGHRSLRH